MECTTCLTQYGQITVSECKREKDTECGCPEGHFKQYSGQDFTCQECTICRNGTQAFKCKLSSCKWPMKRVAQLQRGMIEISMHARSKKIKNLPNKR
ncbi:hypothetical protein AB205_0124400, partial [Aquarana catesbeiana]